MIIAFDLGNTRIKAAVFEQDTMLEKFIFLKTEHEICFKKIFEKYQKATHLVVSSVSELEKKSFLQFENLIKVHFVSHNDVFPFQNKYATPQTLGIDRMVLAAGACLQFPKKNRLIIDSGTCVTYDFVDESNCYLGGAISPGLSMRYKALNNFTAKLPLLSLESPKDCIGNATSESIHSGVVNGLLYEIKGFIEEYESRYSNFIIILTGGDAEFLAKRLKNTIFANSNFLLESLNQTLQYTINNG